MGEVMGQKELERMKKEVKTELLTHIIPFWIGMRDDRYGGYYGGLTYELSLIPEAEKGCILNSRITWFFANAYTLYRQGLFTEEDCRAAGYEAEELLHEAEHGYRFLKEHCLDEKYGGVYWSLRADGTSADQTKHTYNQAFAVYALSSYYEASHDAEALALAFELFTLIEERCIDEDGYLEAFTREFLPQSNEKLSENGVLAERTMNTMLHVLEAYTELFRVTEGAEEEIQVERALSAACGESLAVLRGRVRQRIIWITEVFARKIYNPRLHRQEVFFDAQYRSLIDLHSYGHDIETAWLMDKTLEVLMDRDIRKKISPITRELTAQIYQTAFDGASLANECECGVVNEHRVWWVQAEAVVGFLNGWQQEPARTEYCDAAVAEWQFIREYVVDQRPGSEWYWEVRADGTPILGRPIVEPWKCPYHNGRMCMEVLKRIDAK